MTTAMLETPDAPAAERPASSGWALRVLAGPGAGRRIPLAGRITIGRDAQAGLSIPDQVLSRTHAEVVATDDGWSISDLGSSNGTLVDGVRAAPGSPSALRPGTLIRVGHVLVRVESGIPDLPEVPGFRLLGALGSGSLGEVYAGLDGDGAAVAIKVPAGPLPAARLRNGVARTLDHPGLVPAWLAEGGALVSPWQELGSLAEHLAAGPMEPERVAALAAGLVATLAALETAGIQPVALHPGNILRGLDGRWRLADVLTAAPISAQDPRARFLAPELAAGRQVDAPAVQYALGAILLAGLTGAPPEPGVAPALDPGRAGIRLAVVVPRLCASDPAGRYADWSAVAAALQGRDTPAGPIPVVPARPAPVAARVARPARATMPGWVPWAGAGVIAVVVGVAALSGTGGSGAAPEPVTSDWAPVEVGVKAAGALKAPWWLEGTAWKPGDAVTGEPAPPAEVVVAQASLPVDAEPPAVGGGPIDLPAVVRADEPLPPPAVPAVPGPTVAPTAAPDPGVAPAPAPAAPVAESPLAAAHAARAAGRPARDVIPLFQRAVSAKVPFADEDWIAYGLVLVDAGRRADAQRIWPRVSAAGQAGADGQLLAGQLGLVAPQLRPQVVAATVVGGAGDQFFREVAFTDANTVVARGGQLSLTYNVASGRGSVAGNPSANDGEPFNIRTAIHPKARHQLKDPRNGQTYTWTTNQVHPILMQPELTSSAGWKLWGWTYQQMSADAKSVRWGPLMADSRIYHVWLMPEGRIGASLWCDGGNSSLTADPRDFRKPNPATESGGSMQSSAGGMASMYVLIDPSTGTPISGTFVYSLTLEQVVDPWGRVYLPAGITKNTSPTPIAGAAPDAGSGLFALRPDLRQPALNLRIGGPKGPGQDRFRAIALSGNLLALAGTTSSPQPQLVKPVQGKPGGGQDAYLVVLKLW